MEYRGSGQAEGVSREVLAPVMSFQQSVPLSPVILLSGHGAGRRVFGRASGARLEGMRPFDV